MRGQAWQGASSSLITQAEWGVSQRHGPSLWSELDSVDLLKHTHTHLHTHTHKQDCQAHITSGGVDWCSGEANVFTPRTEIDLQPDYNHVGQSNLPHYYSSSHIITRLLLKKKEEEEEEEDLPSTFSMTINWPLNVFLCTQLWRGSTAASCLWGTAINDLLRGFTLISSRGQDLNISHWNQTA